MAQTVVKLDNSFDGHSYKNRPTGHSFIPQQRGVYLGIIHCAPFSLLLFEFSFEFSLKFDFELCMFRSPDSGRRMIGLIETVVGEKLIFFHDSQILSHKVYIKVFNNE